MRTIQPHEFTGKLSRKWVYLVLSVGLSVSVILGVVGQMQTGFSAQWSHLFLDSFLEYSANGKTAQNAVVVDIEL